MGVGRSPTGGAEMDLTSVLRYKAGEREVSMTKKAAARIDWP